ncbi:MAG: hypothetical protein AB1568_14100 [Thermodesulfobacteriota bacterium]
MTVEIEQDISRVGLKDGFAVAAGQESAGVIVTLRRAKELMLSLEWDIAPATLRQLDGEIDRLEQRWRDDRTAVGLLRILRALGRYLLQAGSATHPAAGKLFFAVYNGVEKVMLTPGLEPQKKKRVLLVAMEKYNLVRRAIDQGKAAGGRAGVPAPAGGAGAVAAPVPPKPGPVVATAAAPAEGIVAALAGIGGDDKSRPTWQGGGDAGIGARLNDFFGDTGGDHPGDGVVRLPAHGETRDGGGLAAGRGDRPSPSAAGDGSANVIADLLKGRPADAGDELLADIHLAVFKESGETTPAEKNPVAASPVNVEPPATEGEIPPALAFAGEGRDDEETPAVVGLDAGQDGAAPSGSELEKKLASFFDEPPAAAAVPAAVPPPAAGFDDALRGTLESVFGTDEADGGGEEGVVALAPSVEQGGDAAATAEWAMLLDGFAELLDDARAAGDAGFGPRFARLDRSDDPGARFLLLFLDRLRRILPRPDAESRRRAATFLSLCRKHLPELLADRPGSRAAMTAVARGFFDLDAGGPGAAASDRQEGGGLEPFDLPRSSQQGRKGSAGRRQNDFMIEDVHIP